MRTAQSQVALRVCSMTNARACAYSIFRLYIRGVDIEAITKRLVRSVGFLADIAAQIASDQQALVLAEVDHIAVRIIAEVIALMR